MISQNEPKYKPHDIVLYHSDIELIIIKTDEWLIKENCWNYIALSRKTNNKVYVNEQQLKLKLK